MNKVSATRMEFLARKAQIALAEQARELLEKKRTALMQELLQEANAAMEQSDILEQAAAHAQHALARAEAVAGPRVVRSAALATRARFFLQVSSTNVMGIMVPHIEQRSVARSMAERGYAPTGTSTTVDEAAAAFEAEVDAIIQLSESELRLARLATEIRGTSRRLNALDYVLIPRLRAERDTIKVTLDERERTEHLRLKLAKRLLERKREQSINKS